MITKASPKTSKCHIHHGELSGGRPSVVYKTLDPVLNRVVALRVLAPHPMVSCWPRDRPTTLCDCGGYSEPVLSA